MKRKQKNQLSQACLLGLLFFVLFSIFIFQPREVRALTGDYSKAINGTLAASEWNNLVNDFVAKSGSRLDGYFSINTATSSTYALDINGALRATSIEGSYTGFLNAANISSGQFGANAGFGNFSFPGNVGIGTTEPNNLLQVNDLITFTNNDQRTQIGYQAGKYDLGQYNTWMGYQAGSANNSIEKTNLADNNTAIGYQSLFSNTTGSFNSAVGTTALFSNTTGYRNVAIGSEALQSNTTGQRNVSIGVGSLKFSLTGNYNTAIGANVLFSNTSGYENVAIGSESLRSNTTGFRSTAVGTKSGDVVADGTINSNSSNSIYIGYDSRSSVDGSSNEIVIGANTIGNGSDSVTLGNTTILKTILRGNVGIGTTTPGATLDVNGLIKMRTALITVNDDVINKGYLDSALASTTAQIITQVSTSSFWQGSMAGNVYNSNAGNVGIGTSAPGGKFHVATTGDTNSLVVNNNSGNILIGTTTDITAFGGAKLQVRGGASAVSTWSGRIIAGGASNVFLMGEIDGRAVLAGHNSGLTAWADLYINPINNSNTYIGNSGTWPTTRANTTFSVVGSNVGIGTINPLSRLHVEGNTGITWNGMGHSYGLVTIGTGSNIGGSLLVRTNSHGDANNWDSGFGVSGTYGAPISTINLRALGLKLEGYSSNLVLSTTSGTTENTRMIIVGSSGNIGIGTTTPSTRLTVVGSGNYSINAGNYRIGNVATPVSALDAVNKSYLDSAVGTAQTAFWNLNGSNLYASSTSWNVGIGTTAPGAKLHILNATSTPYKAIVLDNDSTTDGSGSIIHFVSSSDENVGAQIAGGRESTGGTSYLKFTNYLNGSGFIERMRITGSGNVGIGTTNPTAKLYVNGTSIFNDVATFTQPVIVGAPVLSAHAATKSYVDSQISSSTGAIAFWGGSLAANVWSLNSGNVGIGTTNPTAMLDITKPLTQGTTQNMLSFKHDGSWGLRLVQNFSASGNMQYDWIQKEAGTDKNVMTFQHGNVGIGTMSPNSRLHVYNTAANAEIDIQSLVGAGNHWGTYSNLSDNSYRIWGGSDYLTILRSGNVGIGTTAPGQQLHLSVPGSSGSNGIKFTRTGGYGDASILLGYGTSEAIDTGSSVLTLSSGSAKINLQNKWFSDGSMSRIRFYTMAPHTGNVFQDSMIINEYGNVGIGTTNPAQKLSISGTSLSGLYSQTNISAFTGNGLRINGSIGNSSQDAITYQSGSSGAGAAIAFGRDGNYGTFISMYTNPTASGSTGSIIERLRVDQNGKVGIGTTNPGTYRLNVAGTSNLGGNLTTTGTVSLTGPVYAGGGNRMITVDNAGVLGAAALPTSLPSGTTSYTLRYDGSNWVSNGNIFNNGTNVGIGTTAPGAYRLKVAGDMAVTGTLQTQTGSDFAEEFSVTEDLSAGTVVVMSNEGHKSVKAASSAYDRTVVGIVSDNPSIIAGKVDSEKKVVVAMMGVVSVNVSNGNGRIHKGDLLTSADLTGYAMKASKFKPGTIIGKALEDLKGAKGQIKVLVNLQ